MPHVAVSRLAPVLILTLGLLAFTASAVEAQSLKDQIKPGGTLETFAKDKAKIETSADPLSTLERIINWLMSFVGILSLLAIIWGGIMYILSFGNDTRAALAKRIIVYALIGIVIVVMSFVIISAIKGFLV